VQFLRHVVRSESFAQARLDTALIPREAAVLFNQDRWAATLAVAAAVAQTLLAERAGEGADPFSRRDGWRSHGLTVRRFDFEYQGEPCRRS
jgi:3-methylcrotonyl-CoA carboxylase alpha subunit